MATPLRFPTIKYVGRTPIFSGRKPLVGPEGVRWVQDYRRGVVGMAMAERLAARYLYDQWEFQNLIQRKAQAALNAGAQAAREVSSASRAQSLADINKVVSIVDKYLGAETTSIAQGILGRELSRTNAMLNHVLVRMMVQAEAGQAGAAQYIQRMGLPAELGGSKKGIMGGLAEVDARKMQEARGQILRSIQSDIQRINKQQKEASLRYVYGVANALFQGNVHTAREFKKLIAVSRADIESAAIGELYNFYTREAKMQSAREIYEAFVNEISSKGFKLFIDDTGFIRAVRDIDKKMSSLSYWLSDEVEALIYSVLARTFIEAWSSLSDDQFPREYRDHLLALIYAHQQKGTLKIRGKKIDNWWIAVDFQKLFGNVADLESAYHYGAMTAGGSQIGHLPYVGQNLAHSTVVRYGFWYSMWMGNKMYSPAAARTGKGFEKQHYNKMTKRIQSLRARKDKVEEKWQKYKSTTNDPTRTSSFDNLEYARNEIVYRDKIRKLDYLEQYAIKYKSTSSLRPVSELGDLFDARAMRQDTINQRLAFWDSKGVAPYWWFLEYGQLKYPPIIPPRGVYGRFVINLRKEIDRLVKYMYNKMFARETGIIIDKQGRRRLSGRAYPGEEVITFSKWRDPKTKRWKNISKGTLPGSFLPQTAPLMKNATQTSRRTIAEAERFGQVVTAARGRMAAQETQFEGFLNTVKRWYAEYDKLDPENRMERASERSRVGEGPLRTEKINTGVATSLEPAPPSIIQAVSRGRGGGTTSIKPLKPWNKGLSAIAKKRMQEKGVGSNPEGIGPSAPELPWGGRAGKAPTKVIPFGQSTRKRTT
jgi:hypothetical protein